MFRVTQKGGILKNNRLSQFLCHGLFCLTLSGGPAMAQGTFVPNVFFGIDFILQPLAIKWACGGERAADLAQLEKLMAAFPKDAKAAGLPQIVAQMAAISDRDAAFLQMFWSDLSQAQARRLCTAAMVLNIHDLTPEALRENHDMGPVQATNWKRFFEVASSL